MLYHCIDYFGFYDCHKSYNHLEKRLNQMRKLKDTDIQNIWQRIKRLHAEKENLRQIDRQLIDYDCKRNGFLVRRRDSKFTSA